ncbi:MAG: hypothetical protein KF725_02230 [Cyclobacteriaceae bacterium]|nr:hypothetical protein [Cyclobacteriaceae bacterium]UYN86738.1 MAG: hypothetical protein KIT51_00175 [Cyclobacteriaceae bacterium]
MGKMVPIVNLAFSITCILLPIDGKCQSPIQRGTYGVKIGLGYSGYQNAVSIVYAGPPFFTDLVVSKENLPCYSVELFKIYSLKKFLGVEQAFGFTYLAYKTHFNYDLNTSINNILSIKREFNYFFLIHRLKQEVRISDRISAGATIGLSINYLIRSNAEYINFVNGKNRILYEDKTNSEPRFSLGYEVSGMISYSLTPNLFFQIRPAYTKLIKPVDNKERRIFAYGIGVFFIKKF